MVEGFSGCWYIPHRLGEPNEFRFMLLSFCSALSGVFGFFGVARSGISGLGRLCINRVLRGE